MHYYYTDGKEKKGPFSIDDLLKHIAANNRCYIWKPGLTEWVPPSGIPEVQEAIKRAAEPPPLPPAKPPQELLQTLQNAIQSVETGLNAAEPERSPEHPAAQKTVSDPFKVEHKVQTESRMDAGQGITRNAGAESAPTHANANTQSPIVFGQQPHTTGAAQHTPQTALEHHSAKPKPGSQPNPSSGTQTGSGAQSKPAASPALMDYPKCSVGKRIGGYIIDSIIGFVLFIPASIFIILGANDERMLIPMVMLGMLFFLPPVIYLLIRDGMGKGQSIGKRLMKTMVVDLTTNTPCTKGKSVMRNLISGILSAFPYIGWLVDVVMLFANDKGKRVGDLVASTMVIQIEAYSGKDIFD